MSEIGIIGVTSGCFGGKQESEVDHGEANCWYTFQFVYVGTFGASS
jgi:hypothetical protein